MKARGFLGGPTHQVADRGRDARGDIVGAEAKARRFEEGNDSLGEVLDM